MPSLLSRLKRRDGGILARKPQTLSATFPPDSQIAHLAVAFGLNNEGTKKKFSNQRFL